MRPLLLLPLLAACSPTESARFDAPLQRATPRWATSDRYVGPVAADERVAIQVHLKLRDEAAAEAALREISDPRSLRYRQYLSNAELEALHLPTPAEVAAVRAHLEAHGLRVTYVPENRAFVSAEGSAAQLERAFGTRLGAYRIGEEIRRAPTEAPKLPPSLEPSVRAVLGLATPIAMRSRGVRVGGVSAFDEEPDATAPVCSHWFGQLADTKDPPFGDEPLTYFQCGLTPPQLRQAYGFDEAVKLGLDGSGVKIAIVDAFMSPTLLADAQTYFAAHDPDHPLDAAHFSAQMAPGTPPRHIDTGWYAEQSLDVESAHAIAPGAGIVYVGAQSPNDQDLIAALNLIISQNLATIISNSYGGLEAGSTASDLEPWHSVMTQAGLKGVGVYFSSGDSGDESQNTDNGKPSADFPASLDNATAVGGTSLALRESNSRRWEHGWETSVSRLKPVGDGGAESWQPPAPGEFVYGAGGGVSAVYAQPDWQQLAVPSSLSSPSGKAMRTVPDVAMLADPTTGFLFGQTNPKKKIYGESPIGGTSLACPLFAGSVALAEQLAGAPIGFANPLFYTAAWLGAFHDIVPPRHPIVAASPRGGAVVSYDFQGQTIHTDRGYDTVTGLGVPGGPRFLETVGLLEMLRAALAAN